MANSKPSNFKAYVLAARPKTLFAGLTPVLIALAYCYQANKLNSTLALLTLFVVVLLQIATNYVNDAFDAQDGVDDNNRLGPERMTSLGYLSFEQMKCAYQTTFSIAFIVGLVIVSMTDLFVLGLGVIALIFAYIYTAGPLPLSRIGLGEVAALVFFGPYAIFGAVYIQQVPFDQTIFLISLLPGLASAQLMNINNLRDRQADSKVSKKTISTLVSENTARYFPLFFCIGNLAVVVLLCVKVELLYLTAIIPWCLWILVNSRTILIEEINQKLNTVLARTGAALFVQGLIIAGILIK